MTRPAFEETLGAFRRNPLAFFRLLRGLPTMLRLFWRLLRDPRTPWSARLVLLGTLVYVVSPVDLVPAMLFGPVGLVDDLTVLVFGCQSFIRLVPPPVVTDHVERLAPRDTPPSS